MPHSVSIHAPIARVIRGSVSTIHMIAGENQHFMAERMKARTHSHPVDHLPLVTAPSLVLDIIREAIDQAVAG
jgi:hypothetical protein